MISQKIQKALQGSSAIRAMFVEGNELAARVGRENVIFHWGILQHRLRQH